MFFLFLLANVNFCIGLLKTDAGEPNPQQQQIVGMIFDNPVPLSNYEFVSKTISSFGNPFGAAPKNAREFEELVWEQLVLSYEAFRRNINISEKELEEEVGEILTKEKLPFDYKNDSLALEDWVNKRFGVSFVTYRNQLRHILQLRKLLEEVKKSFRLQITEKELRQVFLDENTSLDLEFALFKDESQAWEFFHKAKKEKGYWEKMKSQSPYLFKRTGLLVFSFLVNAWKFPREDLQRMLKLPLGTIYKPLSVYGGFAVSRLQNRRIADESYFALRRYVYYDKLMAKKNEEALKMWVNRLKDKAKIQIFKQGG